MSTPPRGVTEHLIVIHTLPLGRPLPVGDLERFLHDAHRDYRHRNGIDPAAPADADWAQVCVRDGQLAVEFTANPHPPAARPTEQATAVLPRIPTAAPPRRAWGGR